MNNTDIITAQITFSAVLSSGTVASMSSKYTVIVTDTREAIVNEAIKEANKLLSMANKSSDIRFSIFTPSGEFIGQGSALNEFSASDKTPAQIASEFEAMKSINEKFVSDAMKVLNGVQAHQITLDEDGSELEVDAAKGFSNQDGIYIGTSVLVVSYDKVFTNGVESGAELRIVTRRMYQPQHKLSYAEGHIAVYLASSCKAYMGDKVKLHSQVLEFVCGFMKQASKFSHFIGGRKGVLVFCDRSFGGYEIHKIFSKLNINRMEHMLQLILARGVRLLSGERIKAPERIKSVIADGIVHALTTDDAQRFGVNSGMWQHRSEHIPSKGTILSGAGIVKSFTNLESIKVKALPDTDYLDPQDYIFIANSGESYDMKISHQLGYVLVRNYLKGKVKKAWGLMPDAIVNKIVTEKNENGISKAILAGSPTEYGRLSGLGFPKANLSLPAGSIKRAVKSLRPTFSKMYMLAAMPIEYLDRDMYPNAGIYTPLPLVKGGDDEGTILLRIPFLAVSGGAQSVHTKDAKGKSMWRGYSSFDKVIVFAIHEPTLIMDSDGNEISRTYPDDVKLGGNGASRILVKMLEAEGADSDGDRMALTTKDGDALLKSAGVEFNYDVPILKTKNPYKGINGWSEDMRKKMWVTSTPLLMLVGTGDKTTRQLLDIAFSDLIDLQMWDKAALAGAEVVQRGVSAPKYFMEQKYNQPYKPEIIKNLMGDYKVGSGFDFEGKLYDPAVEAATTEFMKFYPAERAKWMVEHPKREWEGGYLTFLARLDLFNAEMGDNWVTYVEDSFVQELQRMAAYGKEGVDAINARNKFMQLFKNGDARDRVRRYVAQFIHDHKDTVDADGNFIGDKSHIWAWMLSDKFIRPDVPGAMPGGQKYLNAATGQIEAKPFLSPEGPEGKFRILEIMGMPFDLEELQRKEEVYQRSLTGRK